MRLEYDLNVGALYIALDDHLEVAATQEAGGNANVDVSADGQVVGIEVVSAKHPWPVAEVLATYKLSGDDRAMIQAYFLPHHPQNAANNAVPPVAAMREAPVVSAAPTAPIAAAVLAPV
jgi:uncharacterized protein YuzE